MAIMQGQFGALQDRALLDSVAPPARGINSAHTCLQLRRSRDQNVHVRWETQLRVLWNEQEHMSEERELV